MRPVRVLLALFFSALAVPARAQDLKVVAELPGTRPFVRAAVEVRPLVAGGPSWMLNVASPSIRAWRIDGGPEPVVSALPADVRVFPAAAWGDFDGDGRVDVAFSTDGGVALLKGDGTGRFVPAGTIATSTLVTSLGAGDFDGDGRSDVVVSLATPDGTGTPTFTTFFSLGGFRFGEPHTTQLTVSGDASYMSSGDLDGDGRADLVVTPGAGTVSVWRSRGDGTFELTAQLPGWWQNRPALIADLDGDGRPEIVFRYTLRFPPFHVEVYKNDGGGSFHRLPSFDVGPYSGEVFLADLDGGGRPGIAWCEWDPATSAPSVIVVKTLVSGAFAEARLTLPTTLFAPDAAADWDGDGTAEFVAAADGRLQVFGTTGARRDVVVVPVLVSTSGLLGSRFDSDLLLTNSGSTRAHLVLRYTAAAGGGTGRVEADLDAGRQLFAPSAVSFLRDAGLPIDTAGNVIGTLRVEAAGASSPHAVSASVRTTTRGGAGVAYGGTPFAFLLREPSILPWLVETKRDRTNLALVNAGSEADGPVSLRVEVHAGDGSLATAVLDDVVLAPGEFRQIGRVLAASGLAVPAGWARVTRVAGDAPYLAWAAINDAETGDGSFEAAVPERPKTFATWTVPDAVQSLRYATEFVLTNPSAAPVTYTIQLRATGGAFSETVPAGGTFYVPDIFEEFRRRGVSGAPAAGDSMVSAIWVKPTTWPWRVFAGARVSTIGSGRGAYGVFEPATSQDDLASTSMVVPDLRQNDSSRTNLVLAGPGTHHVEITDGDTGRVVAARDVTLANYGPLQINAILKEWAPGTTRAWARVVGFAWAVVNDGAVPGAGTDDGSFVLGIPE